MRHTSSRSGRAGRASLALALTSIIGLLVGSAPVAAAGLATVTIPSIGILVHGTCVDGRDYQAGGSVQVIQKRGTTTLATKTFDIGSSSWTTCGFKAVLEGDKLQVAETVSASVFSDRTVTVPTLTVSLHASTDSESGRVPTPGSLVNPGIDQMIAGLQGYSAAKGVNADGSGRFSVSWTGLVDVRAGDVARMFWFDAEGDTFVVTNATPSLSVEVGKSRIVVTGPYGPTTTAKLRTSKGVLRGTATGTVSGTHSELHATFKASGKAVKVRAGDKVTSSQITGSYKVRASDLVVKKSGNGSLTATCAAGSDYGIFVNGVKTVGGHVGSGGKVSSTNLTNGMGPLFPGSSVKLACRLSSGFGQVFSRTVR